MQNIVMQGYGKEKCVQKIAKMLACICFMYKAHLKFIRTFVFVFVIFQISSYVF